MPTATSTRHEVGVDIEKRGSMATRSLLLHTLLLLKVQGGATAYSAARITSRSRRQLTENTTEVSFFLFFLIFTTAVYITPSYHASVLFPSRGMAATATDLAVQISTGRPLPVK